jgi:arginine decarboxylase
MVLANPTGTCSAADGAALHGIDRWGDPYVAVSERGHGIVQPRGKRGRAPDLVELTRQGHHAALPA